MDTYLNEGTESLRNRILSRTRSPCSGRFDPAWDIEAEFNNDCSQLSQNYKLSMNTCHSLGDIQGVTVFDSLLLELNWAGDKVRDAWAAQDFAIEKSRSLGPLPVPSSTLDDFC